MKLTVIRVDDIRALIYHNLDVNGIRLFEHANQVGEGEREISAVIVGLGRYGTEMVKALLWYCQIPGYRVRITVFDEHEDAKDRFQAMCPDLRIGNFMNEKGDMRYALRIHTARVGTKTFLEKIETVVAPTYVFVSLGDDNENISTAISIRNALQRKSPDSDRRTDIETVVYDSVLKRRVGVAWSDEEKKDAFEETQMSAYQIHTIGDIDSFYSVKTLINSNLIQEGLEVHKRWSNGTDTELAYYMDGYCYFSSVAGALHRRLRLKILRYEPKTQKEKVFPAFCETSDQGADSNPDAMRLIRVCEQLNDNDSVNRLSEQMKKDTHCLYIKLAQLHFGRLSADERYRVLQWVKTASEKKEKEKAEAALKVLARFNDPGSYLQVYEQLLTDYIEQKRSQADDSMAMGEVLRRLFDGIVAIKTATVTDVVEYHRIRQSLDYENQSSEDRLAVEEFVRTVNPQVNLRKIVDDVRAIARLEHVRWNAYMRTEGFRAVANQNKKFKMHSDLVSVELLSLSDCIKDI
ncbi:MAG: hypothetical protein J6R82_07325 [Clostridia bacterium]|nr:hypothetical protein [Clostridia bacterium]